MPIEIVVQDGNRLSKLPASDPHQVKALRCAIGYRSPVKASDSLVIGAHKPYRSRQHGIDAPYPSNDALGSSALVFAITEPERLAKPFR
jgi:hypothetical protein